MVRTAAHEPDPLKRLGLTRWRRFRVSTAASVIVGLILGGMALAIIVGIALLASATIGAGP